LTDHDCDSLTSAASATLDNFFNIGANGSAGDLILNDGALLSAAGGSTIGGIQAGSTASSISFILGSAGFTNPFDIGGTLNIRETIVAQNLIIDAAAYTGGPGTFDLITFNNITGTFGNPTFQNLDPSLAATIGYDGDSAFVTFTAIPEPSSILTVLLLSCLGGYRRKRRFS